MHSNTLSWPDFGWRKPITPTRCNMCPSYNGFDSNDEHRLKPAQHLLRSSVQRTERQFCMILCRSYKPLLTGIYLCNYQANKHVCQYAQCFDFFHLTRVLGWLGMLRAMLLVYRSLSLEFCFVFHECVDVNTG